MVILCFLNLEKLKSLQPLKNIALLQMDVPSKTALFSLLFITSAWTLMELVVLIFTFLGFFSGSKKNCFPGPDGFLNMSYEVHITLVAFTSSVRDTGLQRHFSC